MSKKAPPSGTLFGVLLGTFSKKFSSTFFKTLPGTILADVDAKMVLNGSLSGSFLEPFSKKVDLAFLVDPPLTIKGFCFQKGQMFCNFGILFRRCFQRAFGETLFSNFNGFGDPPGTHFGTKFVGGPF